MSQCTHRYRLGEQNGSPYVTGTCRHCGHTRTYGASEDAVDRLTGTTPTWSGPMTVKAVRRASGMSSPAHANTVRVCGNCARQFASLTGRLSHERVCVTGKLNCPQCGAVKKTSASKLCRSCNARATTARRNMRVAS